MITHSLKTNTGQEKNMPKTTNRFSILEYFSEEVIEKLLTGEHLEDKPKKKKCPFCGFKTTCHENKHKCNASGAICKYCSKPDHLPKSQRCLKKRKERFIMKQISKKSKQGCETLR